MIIDDLFVIQKENNDEYSNYYDSKIKITSYTHMRNTKDWKKTVDLCSDILYQEIKKIYPLLNIWFWVRYRFYTEPTYIQQYKGVFNDKRLDFLDKKKLAYQGTHFTVDKLGCSALVEITDKELFSSVINYLRNSDEGIIFLNSKITNFVDFDNEIYSKCEGFSSLVNSLVKKDFIILRPFGSFDDREFCIEIYENTFC